MKSDPVRALLQWYLQCEGCCFAEKKIGG